MNQPQSQPPAQHAPCPRTPAAVADAHLYWVRSMADILRDKLGLAEQEAEQWAEAIVRGLRERHGGDDVYIPAADKAERDAAIRKDFNGRNLTDVMARYQVSKSTVYRICNS